METIPVFGFQETCNVIVGDMANALSERKGESLQQQFVRTQAAIFMIMAFLPRDVIETLLASHCVMFHTLMVDSARDIVRADNEKTVRATQNGLLGLNKAFGRNLDELRHYQRRPAQGQRDAATESAGGRRDPVSGAPADDGRRSSETPAAPNDFGPAVPMAEQAAKMFRPSADAVAACRINPEAMAALEAGDAAGFARAMGIDKPSDDFLAAANSPGSPFDRKTAGPWSEVVSPVKRKH